MNRWTLRLLVLREAEAPEELEPLMFDRAPLLPSPGETIEVHCRRFQVANRKFGYTQLDGCGHTVVTFQLLSFPPCNRAENGALGKS